MRGKRVLITGATDGIGKIAALDLAKMGAEITIVGRNEAKTGNVLRELISDSGNANIDYLIADLSSFANVRAVAHEFLSRYDRLDVLLNNAGAVFSEFQVSADGYEMTFALNHMSYYLLTCLLLDTLKQTAAEQGEARIINVSSSAHLNATMQLDNLRDPSEYSLMKSYGASKLMNVLFTYELARRLQDSNVTVNAVHPGMVNTGIGHDIGRFWGFVLKVLQRLFAVSPQQGAEPLVYLASSPDARGITGKYWDKKQQERSSEISYDQAQQEQLWQFSASIAGIE